MHFEASDAPTQDTGGRFDFFRGLPVGHVGVAALAALAAFNFLGTSCTHKIADDDDTEPIGMPPDSV